MANIQINQLPAGTTPLTGNELIPVDQGTDTVKITTADVVASTWKLAGNTGTDSSVDFIGTTDAQDLVFKTNGTEQLRISDSDQTIYAQKSFNAKGSESSVRATNLDGSVVASLEQGGGNFGTLVLGNGTGQAIVQCSLTTNDRIFEFPDESGTIALKSDILGYKSYVAKITQSGTNDPELQEIINDIGIVINWVRVNIGSYEASLTGYTMGADSGRVTITCAPGSQPPVGITIYSSLYNNAGTMTARLVSVANYTGAFIAATGVNDSLLNEATVEIRVYP